MKSLAQPIWILCLTAPLAFGASDQAALMPPDPPKEQPAFVGTMRQWQPISLIYQHLVETSETDPDNPFLNYRLNVLFTRPDGTQLVVPGYYAADGLAHQTSAEAGSRWIARLLPDQPGTWTFQTSFRRGPGIAVETDFNTSGHQVQNSFHGQTGTFEIGIVDPTAPGNYARGILRDVGEHHLRFAENHEYFVKGGANSPENFLGYYEFDNTYDLGDFSPATVDGLHHYDAHLVDFDENDPIDLAGQWHGLKGRRILGAVNYLAERGINSIYFIVYTADGDGTDTWVWRDPSGPGYQLRFDVSKLEQWEKVFTHMDRRGLQLHLVMQEIENDQELGIGLTTERKLYFRELVARFAHHPALIWNIGEENSSPTIDQSEFADYIDALDPYDHPVTVHTQIGGVYSTYTPLLPNDSIGATSIQSSPDLYNELARNLRGLSEQAGNKWAVYADEQFAPSIIQDMSNLAEIRCDALWGNLLGGGAGVEWFFDFADVALEDFSQGDELWADTDHALHFLRTYTPFWRMEPDNELTVETDDFVLAEIGEIYVVYRTLGGGASLILPDDATYTVDWFDPREGGALLAGSLTEVVGANGAPVWLGSPPSGATEDWTALVRRVEARPPVIVESTIAPEVVTNDGPFLARVRVEDPNGPTDVVGGGIFYIPPGIGHIEYAPLDHQGGNLWVSYQASMANQNAGNWVYALVFVDSTGLFTWTTGTFELVP